MEPLLEAWRKNNAANLLLLEHVSDAQLDLDLPKSKSIRGHFAHVVNVRRMKLKMSGRDLLDTEEKSDRHRATREALRADMNSTSEAIERLFARIEAPSSKLKATSVNAATSMAGLLVHEGSHRGQIEATLRIAGQELPAEVQLVLWDWSKP